MTDSDGSTPKEATPQALPAEWEAYLKPFADATGLAVDKLTEALTPIVGEPGQEAIELLQSEDDVPFEKIAEVVKNAAPPKPIPDARLRKIVREKLRVKAAAPAAEAPAAAVTSFTFLPAVRDDDAWLNALKDSGVSKVTDATVEAAIRAGLASRVGLFDVLVTIQERMSAHAESIDEQFGDDYYEIDELLTERRYGEVFAALRGKSKFTTQAAKKKLIGKLDTFMWTALIGFQGQLKGWVDSWSAGMNNPAMMMTMLPQLIGGAKTGVMPPGFMAPPDTGILRDAAEGVIRQINKVFAGPGAIVTQALSWDALCIRKLLANDKLPMQVGAPNREQMLKILGIGVAADYPRLEQNVVRYALAVLNVAKIPGGNDELRYWSELFMLGNQIPWDRLAVPAPTGRSAPRRSPFGAGDQE